MNQPDVPDVPGDDEHMQRVEDRWTELAMDLGPDWRNPDSIYVD